MTNAELINALRVCADCIDLRNGTGRERCTVGLMRSAADALEAADRLLDQNTKRCEGLRQQLREAHESYEKHINELEAQLPKEGEWIEKWRFKTDGTPFHKIGDMECSVCHGDMLGRYYSKYCPHCGALLRGEHDEQIH